jgi:P4 family phage/plasmid primase-like protien
MQALFDAGRRIFPVKYQDKKPAIVGWKDCDETAFDKFDMDKINKGMIVGQRSGVLTLDLDFKHPEAERFWIDHELELMCGTVVNTGNGKHCHFKHPGQLTTSSIGGISRGVDLLCDTKDADGARYVLIPDSLHPNGKHYEYDDPFGPTLEDELPELPQSMLDLINDRSQWKGKLNDGGAPPQGLDGLDPAQWYAENPHVLFSVDPFDDEPILEGNRNNDLARIAGKLLYMNENNSNYLLEDLKDDMLDINTKRCDPPVDVLEIDQLCDSIWKTKVKRDARKAKEKPRTAGNLDGFKMGFDDDDSNQNQAPKMGVAFLNGVIPCPEEKPEIKGDVNMAAVWLAHQPPFAPTTVGNDHNLIYLEDTFYQRFNNVWTTVSEQSIEAVAQSYYFGATRSQLGNLMNFLKNYLYLQYRDIPFWKAGFPTPNYPANPRKIIPFGNGLLDVEHFLKTGGDKVGALKPFTDNLFNTIKLPYNFDANAKCPVWLSFLKSLWGSDVSDRALALQQWIGHMMIPDITMQKIALLHGVPRSGKSTIGKIIQRVIGNENTVATNLQAMAMDHGLAGFVGKTMAVLFDAHLGARGQGERAIEVLKGISGGDPQNINRKFHDTYSATLSTRIMIICNEMPRLRDSGDALLARLIPFRFEKSFLGHENPNLERDLINELPGIANWALDGIKAYITQGYLSMPTEGTSDLLDLKRVLNPVSAFLDDCLVYPAIGPNDSTPVPDLHKIWLAWCEEGYITYVDSKDRFLSKLRALIPGVMQIRKGGVLQWKGLRIRDDAKLKFLDTSNANLF